MKTNLILILGLVCGLLVMNGCKKSSDVILPPPTDTTTHNQPPASPEVVYVTASLTGRVLDEQGLPVSGAAVRAGAVTATTDINGQFTLANARVDKNAAYFTAQKDGYFTGSKTILLSEGSTTYTELKLALQGNILAFDGETGGSIDLGNGAGLDFPANAVIDPQSGSAYPGTVTVNARWLDPGANNFAALLPGTLTGIARDSSLKVLQPFSTVVIELEGDAGQTLKLAGGRYATIHLPVAKNFTGIPPSSLPLWWFDEQKGLWREDTTAKLSGTTYTGSVAHFSSWMAANPVSSVLLRAKTTNAGGEALPFLPVAVVSPAGGASFALPGTSDRDGNVLMRVAAGAAQVLTASDVCGNMLANKNFTSTAADVNLGAVAIADPVSGVQFSGKVTNCEGNPVTSGVVSVLFNNNLTQALIHDDGTFTLVAPNCSGGKGRARLLATDDVTNLQDSLVFDQVTQPAYSGIELKACPEGSGQFITYTIEGQTTNLTTASYLFGGHFDQMSSEYAYIEGVSNADANNYLRIADMDSALNVQQTSPLIFLSGYDSVYSVNTVTLSEFGAPGSGYVAGKFSGQVVDRDPPYSLHAITGTFRVKRED